MKKIIFITLSLFLLSSCSSKNLNKNLKFENAKSAHQKFSNINNVMIKNIKCLSGELNVKFVNNLETANPLVSLAF